MAHIYLSTQAEKLIQKALLFYAEHCGDADINDKVAAQDWASALDNDTWLLESNEPSDDIALLLSLSPEQLNDIQPRRPYRNDPEEAKIGYFERNSDWVENNIEACVWFLTQCVGDTCQRTQNT